MTNFSPSFYMYLHKNVAFIPEVQNMHCSIHYKKCFVSYLFVCCGGNATGVLWNFARAASCPFCGREALLATKTPGFPLFEIRILSSLSMIPGPDGSLNEGRSKSVNLCFATVQ